MGKYSHLQLPKFIDPDAKAREKVQAVKDQIMRPAPDLDREALLGRVGAAMEEAAFRLDVVNQHLLHFAGGKNYATIFARGYRETRAVKEALQEQLKAIELTLEAYSQLAIDQFEVEGTTSLKLDDGSTVRVQGVPYAGVEDKQKFRLWCIGNDLEDQLTLNPAKTAALTKERLLQGLPEPDGVRAFMKDTIVFKGGSGDDGGFEPF